MHPLLRLDFLVIKVPSKRIIPAHGGNNTRNFRLLNKYQNVIMSMCKDVAYQLAYRETIKQRLKR